MQHDEWKTPSSHPTVIGVEINQPHGQEWGQKYNLKITWIAKKADGELSPLLLMMATHKPTSWNEKERRP